MEDFKERRKERLIDKREEGIFKEKKEWKIEI